MNRAAQVSAHRETRHRRRHNELRIRSHIHTYIHTYIHTFATLTFELAAGDIEANRAACLGIRAFAGAERRRNTRELDRLGVGQLLLDLLGLAVHARGEAELVLSHS